MKCSIFIVSAAASAFVLGCQDTTVTDPLTVAHQSAVHRAKILPIDHIILLTGRLENPGTGSPFIVIRGELSVTVTELPAELPAGCAWTRSEVRIQASAELKPFKLQKPTWRVYGNSTNEVFYEVQAELEKTYVLQNRKDGMALHVRLVVTREGVELENMWLEIGPAKGL
jgi:hypothetical protein